MKARILGKVVEVATDRVRAEGRSVNDQAHVPVGALAGPSPYRSKLESAYAAQLEGEKRAGLILDYWYEPFSFKLCSGKRYRPDFLVKTGSGLECVEVKGYHRNLRDSLTHLKWAAQKFPCFKWRRVWREGHGFASQEIVV